MPNLYALSGVWVDSAQGRIKPGMTHRALDSFGCFLVCFHVNGHAAHRAAAHFNFRAEYCGLVPDSADRALSWANRRPFVNFV